MGSKREQEIDNELSKNHEIINEIQTNKICGHVLLSNNADEDINTSQVPEHSIHTIEVSNIPEVSTNNYKSKIEAMKSDTSSRYELPSTKFPQQALLPRRRFDKSGLPCNHIGKQYQGLGDTNVNILNSLRMSDLNSCVNKDRPLKHTSCVPTANASGASMVFSHQSITLLIHTIAAVRSPKICLDITNAKLLPDSPSPLNHTHSKYEITSSQKEVLASTVSATEDFYWTDQKAGEMKEHEFNYFESILEKIPDPEKKYRMSKKRRENLRKGKKHQALMCSTEDFYWTYTKIIRLKEKGMIYSESPVQKIYDPERKSCICKKRRENLRKGKRSRAQMFAKD